MKKLIYVLVFILSFGANAKDFIEYCPILTPDKTVSGALASVSGVNLLSRNIIESQIAKALKEETNSKFDVKINNFYGVNILSGQFRNLRAKSDLFSYNGLFLSDLDVNTICPYNKVSYKDDKLNFDENMVLKYSAKVTQNEINKMVSSSQYQKIIDELNNDEIISSILKIKDTKVELKDNKLLFKYKVLPGGINFFKMAKNTIDLVFSADLKIKDGQIKICNFGLNSKLFGYNMFLPIINKFNPTNWQIDIDKDNKGEIQVKNVKIENSTIFMDGLVFIAKS